MFGFRFFWMLSMALCICVLNWGQARAANPAATDLRLVAAANVTPKKTKQGPNESNAANAPSGAKAAKQAKKTPGNAQSQDKKNVSAKTTRSPPKGKSAAGPVIAPLDSKAAAYSWVRHKRHGLLPPPSAELPQHGTASWVGRSFHGKPVAARGEVHVMESFTAAHRAIPFHSILKVTDMHNGRSVLVRVNDRGPYIRGRIIDLARGAAEYLRYADRGLTTVRLELVGNDNDPALRYYIRMLPDNGARAAALMQGFGPFDKFDEAAALFASVYKSYPNAELMAVREQN